MRLPTSLSQCSLDWHHNDTIAPPVVLTAAQEAFINPLFRRYKVTMENLGNLAYIQSHTSEFRRIVPSQQLSSTPVVVMKANGEKVELPSPHEQFQRFLQMRNLSAPADWKFADLDKQAVATSASEQADLTGRGGSHRFCAKRSASPGRRSYEGSCYLPGDTASTEAVVTMLTQEP